MCDKKRLKDESRDFVKNQHQILRANVIRNVYQTSIILKLISWLQGCNSMAHIQTKLLLTL